ncbi:TrkH family potassium uptake protein [Halococcus thailandensis]|uniref:TrkH family potassium uptake protein n=1 Tax=Halococcus thailandensis TaxID=335952 RepID=UPI0006779AEE|nr:TrkH family potassium uptake protein [Halococcus thailandensis]
MASKWSSSRLRVDWRTSIGLVGTIVKYLSTTLLIPLAVALFYGRDVLTFAVAFVVTVIVGLALERVEPEPDLGTREGFLMVALTWLVVALVGTVPYLLSGMGTGSTLAHPINALFESMSGFTTTGATMMGEISFAQHSHALLLWRQLTQWLGGMGIVVLAVAAQHSHALLLWRQLTQWLGGMGIVVLAVAILPELSVGGAQLMDAEAPGPGIEKLTPRIAETARVLWLVYLGLTVLEMLLLYGLHLGGLAPNMELFNAVSHALTTLPTGGFSPEARSIEAFSAAVQWLIIPFMVAAGANFALFWHALTGNPEKLTQDTELRSYVGVIGVLTAVIAGLLFTGVGIETVTDAVPPIIGQVEDSVRHALFNIVSIITTTGFANMDFTTWSAPAKTILFFAMFIGGSAGSTGSAIKIIRWVVIVKSLRRELFTTVHPEAVSPVRLAGRVIDERAIRGIYAFTLLYIALFVLASLLVVIDSWRVGYTISTLEATSAIASTLGNVGPGFGAVGPMNNYLAFPATSKLLMTFLMWIGRLEILPVLVLLTPSYWRT